MEGLQERGLEGQGVLPLVPAAQAPGGLHQVRERHLTLHLKQSTSSLCITQLLAALSSPDPGWPATGTLPRLRPWLPVKKWVEGTEAQTHQLEITAKLGVEGLPAREVSALGDGSA